MLERGREKRSFVRRQQLVETQEEALCKCSLLHYPLGIRWRLHFSDVFSLHAAARNGAGERRAFCRGRRGDRHQRIIFSRRLRRRRQEQQQWRHHFPPPLNSCAHYSFFPISLASHVCNFSRTLFPCRFSGDRFVSGGSANTGCPTEMGTELKRALYWAGLDFIRDEL